MELVSRIHVIGRYGVGIVVCAAEGDKRFLPGGRRRPGETLEETVDRELVEEAGARRTAPLTMLGAQRAVSRRATPVYPGYPHPVAYWAYAVTDVALDGAPTNPLGDEQVTEVAVLPPPAAADFVAEHDPVHADVIRLAAAMRLI